MTKETVLANLFDLRGDHNLIGGDTWVMYSSTSFTGEPQLSYRSQNHNQTFMGKKITKEKITIGLHLSVNLETIPDLKTVTFSLILPEVRIFHGSAGVQISVPGIVTTAHTTIGGPPAGADKTYQMIGLHGTAQHVMF